MTSIGIKEALSEKWSDIKFSFRTKVATVIIRHWSKVLWTAFFLTVVLLLCIIGFAFHYWKLLSKMQWVGLISTVLFGLFTILSFLISVTVLNSIREPIPHYIHAGSAFERIIKSTTSRLLILTENPAFLQVLDLTALGKWLDKLKEKISEKGVRVIGSLPSCVGRGYLIMALRRGRIPDEV